MATATKTKQAESKQVDSASAASAEGATAEPAAPKRKSSEVIFEVVGAADNLPENVKAKRESNGRIGKAAMWDNIFTKILTDVAPDNYVGVMVYSDGNGARIAANSFKVTEAESVEAGLNSKGQPKKPYRQRPTVDENGKPIEWDFEPRKFEVDNPDGTKSVKSRLYVGYHYA